MDEVIEQAGLQAVARRKAGGFSLGMRQRLGIATAMLGDPPVLILDEPFNGMDPQGIVWMRGFLRSLAAEGRAVLVSSHLMSELECPGAHCEAHCCPAPLPTSHQGTVNSSLTRIKMPDCRRFGHTPSRIRTGVLLRERPTYRLWLTKLRALKRGFLPANGVVAR